MNIKNKILDDRYKIIIIIIFLGILLILTYFFEFILNTTVIISHFYYLPVILSCVWWQKKGLLIALFLAVLLLLSPIFQGLDILTLTDIDNILRAMFLFIVGIVVSFLSVRVSKSQHELKGRVKELNCLYGITKVVSNPNISIEEILLGVLDRMKCALKYPKNSCIKIIFRGREYKTENFRITTWKITKEISIENHKLNIDVHYLEPIPFSQEEQKLLEKILEELKATFQYKLAWIK